MRCPDHVPTRRSARHRAPAPGAATGCAARFSLRRSRLKCRWLAPQTAARRSRSARRPRAPAIDDQQAQQPGIARRHGPAAHRDRRRSARYRTAARRSPVTGSSRAMSGRPKNCLPSTPVASWPVSAISMPEFWSSSAAVAIEPVDVDDGRDDAPEPLVRPVRLDEDGKAPDEALAALPQLDRAGQHQFAGIARPAARLPAASRRRGSRDRSPSRCPSIGYISDTTRSGAPAMLRSWLSSLNRLRASCGEARPASCPARSSASRRGRAPAGCCR